MCWQNNLALYKSNLYSTLTTVQNLGFLLFFIIKLFRLLQSSKLLPLLPVMEPECFYIQSFPQEIRKIVKWEHNHLNFFNTNATTITGIKEGNRTNPSFPHPFKGSVSVPWKSYCSLYCQNREITAFLSSWWVSSCHLRSFYSFLHLLNTKQRNLTADNQRKGKPSTNSVKPLWYLLDRTHCGDKSS